MDRSRLTLIALCLTLLRPPHAVAATGVWSSHGPDGGVVLAVTIDPTSPATVYAGTAAGGVFKSLDAGASWSHTALTLVDTSILIVDPTAANVLYAGTQLGLFKSIDGGGTWVPKASPGSPVLSMAIDPVSSSTLYAGTITGGVFRSIDGGASWTAINTGLTSLQVPSLAVDSGSPDIVYAGTIGGVFKSIDGGDTWTPTGFTEPAYVLAIAASAPSTLYAGSGSGRVYKSIDGGVAWSQTDTGAAFQVRALAIDPAAASVVYAGGNGGLFKTTDGGASWSPAVGGANTSVNALAIDPTASNTLFAGAADAGIYKSIDGAASWQASNQGLVNSTVQALAIDPLTPTTVYAGTDAPAGVSVTSDGGETWNQTDPVGASIHSLAIDPLTPSTLYAGADGVEAGFKTSDAGANWSAGFPGLTSNGEYALAIDRTAPTTIYAGTLDGGIYKSTDAGAVWTGINNGLPAPPLCGDPFPCFESVLAVAIDPLTSSTIYAGTATHGVFKSIDAGGSWTASGLANQAIAALAIDPITPAMLYAGMSFGDVLKSIDGGATWNPTGVSTLVHAVAVDPLAPSFVYAGGELGVYRSSDRGKTWSVLSGGATPFRVHALAIDPQTPAVLYAGTFGGGVYRMEQASVCGNGTVEPGEQCDDGNVSDGDCCTSICRMPSGCLSPGRSTLVVRDVASPSADRLVWKWLRGTTTSLELGDPLVSTSQHLCLWDDGVLKLDAVVDAAGNCGSSSCWHTIGNPTKGFRYKNAATNADGISHLREKIGSGNASIVAKAKGSSLSLPGAAAPARYFDQQIGVTVQLVRSDAPVCWQSTFTSSRRNLPTLFDAVSP